MGEVSGAVFRHPGEKTLYVAGDTIWCKEVADAIRLHRPDVIIVNGGAARFQHGDPITMDKDDILHTHQAAPRATIVVSRMEAVNHCTLTREELARFIEEHRLNDSVLVPADGELIEI